MVTPVIFRLTLFLPLALAACLQNPGFSAVSPGYQRPIYLPPPLPPHVTTCMPMPSWDEAHPAYRCQ